MPKQSICFSADRTCHHDDYCLLISKFLPITNVKSLSKKIWWLLSNRTIFFLDIDSYDLLFAPLIILRSLWGGKGFGVSVRTEYLIQPLTFIGFIRNIATSKYPHLRIKQFLFYLIKNFSHTSIISIHKNHPDEDSMTKYVDAFVYDPQLWDLSLLKFQPTKPTEIPSDFFDNDMPKVLIPGRLNEQRSRDELMHFLLNKKEREQEPYIYLIAGTMAREDEDRLRNLSYCVLINRFVSNEELHYLMSSCNFVYCFYTNDRPSGFFGRSIQLNKWVLTRKNGYLHNNYSAYNKQLAVDVLEEFPKDKFDMLRKPDVANPFDNSIEFGLLMSKKVEVFTDIGNIAHQVT